MKTAPASRAPSLGLEGGLPLLPEGDEDGEEEDQGAPSDAPAAEKVTVDHVRNLEQTVKAGKETLALAQRQHAQELSRLEEALEATRRAEAEARRAAEEAAKVRCPPALALLVTPSLE